MSPAKDGPAAPGPDDPLLDTRIQNRLICTGTGRGKAGAMKVFCQEQQAEGTLAGPGYQEPAYTPGIQGGVPVGVPPPRACFPDLRRFAWNNPGQPGNAGPRISRFREIPLNFRGRRDAPLRITARGIQENGSPARVTCERNPAIPGDILPLRWASIHPLGIALETGS